MDKLCVCRLKCRISRDIWSDTSDRQNTWNNLLCNYLLNMSPSRLCERALSNLLSWQVTQPNIRIYILFYLFYQWSIHSYAHFSWLVENGMGQTKPNNHVVFNNIAPSNISDWMCRCVTSSHINIINVAILCLLFYPVATLIPLNCCVGSVSGESVCVPHPMKTANSNVYTVHYGLFFFTLAPDGK